jgi:hypothetical protein
MSMAYFKICGRRSVQHPRCSSSVEKLRANHGVGAAVAVIITAKAEFLQIDFELLEFLGSR